MVLFLFTSVTLYFTTFNFSNKLNGEYDITIMPLIKLWGFYKDKVDNVPTKEEIEQTKKLVDYKKIIIDKKDKRVKIDKN